MEVQARIGLEMFPEEGRQKVMERFNSTGVQTVSGLNDIGYKYLDRSGSLRRSVHLLHLLDTPAYFPSPPAVIRCISPLQNSELTGTWKSVPEYSSPPVQREFTQQRPPLDGMGESKPRYGRAGKLQCDGCRKAKKGWKVKLTSHIFF